MSLEKDIAELRQRVTQLEDENAVRDLMMTYCLAADAESHPPTDAERQRVFALYTEDCEMDVDRKFMFKGRASMASLQPPPELDHICAHIIGPLKVRVEGETATATGYTTLYQRETDGRISVLGQGFSEWRLVKHDGHWRIHRRLSRQSSDAEGKALFARAAEA